MKLFSKIFLSFTIAMTLTIVGSIIVSFRLAEQAIDQDSVENREELIAEAAAALEDGGEAALSRWLAGNRNPSAVRTVYVLRSTGEDLLGVDVPMILVRAVTRSATRLPFGNRNFRPRQFAPRLIGTDGEEYSLVFWLAPPTLLGVLNWPSAQVAVATIAVILTALTALLLARYLSSPIAQLQLAARAIAAGRLSSRVGQPFNERKDEVGELARDFDAMAEQVEGLVAARDTLLRDVSHELRSPLARIRVALALADRSADSPDAKRQIARIERESERLDELIGQILELTRLRTRPGLILKPVDMTALVREIAENARFERPEAQVNFSANDKAMVAGDLPALRSAVENVIRNALAYAATPGTVDITLQLVADRCVITIADNGPGVAPAEIERIFEAFYREDPSRDRDRGGHGIGLAITANVIGRHGGGVSASNRAEGGLEVTIELPLVAA